MDRRNFLKATALGAGAMMVDPAFKADAKTLESATPLEVKGYVKESARKIPVVDSADVVVAGGGPAGVAAAVAAARQGADVIILERLYFMGGLFTGCGVTPVINVFSPTHTGRTQAIFGYADELIRRLDGYGMIMTKGVVPRVDPEAAKYIMEETLAEAGVRILYGVQAAQVTMSGDRIESVIIEGKSGRVAINCKFVIDCTGDGDILDWTGEDFTIYKNDIGAMWRLGNAGPLAKEPSAPTRGVVTRHSKGELDQDGLDMYNLTRVQLGLRKMIWEDFLKKRKTPGCEDLFIVDSPALVGVRVTRVLNSVANVTAMGALEGKSYGDVIGFTGSDSTLKIGDIQRQRKDRKIWQVPYSAITPKKVTNLLVAGRCFGYEQPLTYDAREIGTCLMTGQAAGTAAGIAVERHCANRDMDIAELQKRLRAQNVKLDW